MAAGLWVLALFADAAAFGGEAPVQALVPHATRVRRLVGVRPAPLRHRGRRRDHDRRAGVPRRPPRRARRRGATGSSREERRRLGMAARGRGRARRHRRRRGRVRRAPTARRRRPRPWSTCASIGRGPGPGRGRQPARGRRQPAGRAVRRGRCSPPRSATPHYWRLTALEEYDPADPAVADPPLVPRGRVGRGPPAARPTAADVRPRTSTSSSAACPASGCRRRSSPTACRRRHRPPLRPRLVVGRSPAAARACPTSTYDLVAARPDVHAAVPTARPRTRRSTPSTSRNPQVSQAVLDTLRAATEGATGYDGTAPGAAGLLPHAVHLRPRRRLLERSPIPTAAFLARQRASASSSPRRSRSWPALIGIPSRVAVGFTYGDADRASPTRTAGPSGWSADATPTPGPRCTSTAPDGCRSSRPPAAATPTPRSSPASRPSRTATGRGDRATTTTTTAAPNTGIVPTTVADNGQVDLDRAAAQPAPPPPRRRVERRRRGCCSACSAVVGPASLRRAHRPSSSSAGAGADGRSATPSGRVRAALARHVRLVGGRAHPPSPERDAGRVLGPGRDALVELGDLDQLGRHGDAPPVRRSRRSSRSKPTRRR